MGHDDYMVVMQQCQFPDFDIWVVVISGDSEIKNLPVNSGDVGLVPRLGRSPRGEQVNPLKYSCLENPMGRGVWWSTGQGHKELDMNEAPQHTGMQI